MYAQVKVLEPSSISLTKFVRHCNLLRDSEDDQQSFHSTILVTNQYAYCTIDYDTVHFAKPIGYQIFQTRFGNNCLVLLLSAPSLIQRHNELKKLHNVSHSFGNYCPHITLAYDVDDLDCQSLPPYEETIILGDEMILPDGTIKTKCETKWTKIQKTLLAIL